MLPYLVLALALVTVGGASHAQTVELTQFLPPSSASKDDERMALRLLPHVSSNTVPRSMMAIKAAPLQPQARKNSTLPPCLSAYYAPAPWLSPDVERRRSLHYGTIVKVACEVGLSASLLEAVVSQESGYRALAISRAGAKGLMQLMPATARDLGVERSFDPLENLRGGARYLRRQLQHFGRIDLALAAYNAGPERVSLRQGRIPAIAETRAYVRSVIDNWERYTKHASRAVTAHAQARRERDLPSGRAIMTESFR